MVAFACKFKIQCMDENSSTRRPTRLRRDLVGGVQADRAAAGGQQHALHPLLGAALLVGRGLGALLALLCGGGYGHRGMEVERQREGQHPAKSATVPTAAAGLFTGCPQPEAAAPIPSGCAPGSSSSAMFLSVLLMARGGSPSGSCWRQTGQRRLSAGSEPASAAFRQRLRRSGNWHGVTCEGCRDVRLQGRFHSG